MITKCHNCGHKNSELNFSCEKCWEEFRQSKEKYNKFIKENKERITEEEKTTEIKEKQKKISPRFANLLCRIPLFWFLFHTKSFMVSWGSYTINAIKFSLMTVLLLIFNIILMRFARKNNKWKVFMNTTMTILFLIVFIWVSAIFYYI